MEPFSSLAVVIHEIEFFGVFGVDFLDGFDSGFAFLVLHGFQQIAGEVFVFCATLPITWNVLGLLIELIILGDHSFDFGFLEE